MKTNIRPLSARGFTLMELLVVISIIAILTSIAMSSYKGVVVRARNLDALSTARGLTSAIQNYYGDYGRLPVRAGSPEEPVELSAGSPLLKILLGDDEQRLNPKRTPYLSDPKMGRNGAGGLVGKEDSFALADPWGTPYRVVMDANDDHRVTNPDARNEDRSIADPAPAWLPLQVIAYSAGADKRFGTHDDVVSWH